MRLSIIILLLTTSLLHVHGTIYGQKVSLDVKNADLMTVFKTIEKQTGYFVWMTEGQLQAARNRKLTLRLQNAPLTQALDACIKGTPLTYKIVDDAIIIGMINFSAPEPGARLRITGRVTDQKTGNPLPGVTVRIKGTNAGTATDAAGNYILEGDPDGVVVFSFVGYRTFEIKINGQTIIDITMVENEAQLKETVVKGYYNTTKELNTGNVSTIKAEEISHQPVGDPMTALISRVPGLNVQQTSGVAGRRLIVRLRGQNSLDNGNEPLFIVDGVQYNSGALNNSSNTFTAGGLASPFNYLNPADIESIEVLKDADATAIYGSRGANGVILINTKKAKDGKLELDARFYSGISEAPLRLEFMDTQEYLAMRHQAFANDKKQPAAADYDLNGTWDTTRYTDWQKYFIGGTAPANDASIGVSMGNNNTSFRMGANYRTEGTIYPGDFMSKRAGVNFSANHSGLNDRLKFMFTGSYGYSQNNLPIGGVEQYITLAPVAPKIYNEDGTLNWAKSTWANPLAPYRRNALEKSKTLISNLTVSYNILKSLIFKTSFGYTFTNFKQRNIQPYSSFDPNAGLPPNAVRNQSVINNDIRTFVVEPQLSFNENLLGGDFDATIGSTLQGSSGDQFSFSATGFNSDAIIQNLGAATTIGNLQRTNTEYKYNALFGRVGYSYQQKYVLNLTARRDASSRFGPGRKAGNFGAIGAAWIFSNEEFLKAHSDIISFGKLRFSYGSTGNDQIGEYKYLDTYSVYTTTYQGNTSFTPTQLTNPFYGWERVNKIELGLELGFVDNRISLTTSAYRNRTKNQLVQIPLPYTTGFDRIRANLPATIQNTGIEFELRTSNIEKRNFTWNTSFNLTIPRNKLVSFPGIASSSYATRYVVGQPINTLQFLYEYTGINPANGLFMFKDVNGDGSLTSSRDYLPKFVGQRFYGGLYNNFKVGAFEIDFQIQFTKQTGFAYLNVGNAGGFGAGRGNLLANIDEIPHQPYTMSNFDVIINGSYFSSSSGIITDASFIRLKNAGVYYTLPILKKAIKRGRVFVQGQNLATISDYVGFDPESPSAGIIIPPLRTVVAGVQITL